MKNIILGLGPSLWVDNVGIFSLPYVFKVFITLFLSIKELTKNINYFFLRFGGPMEIDEQNKL